MWSKTPLKCDVTLPPSQRSLYYQLLSNNYNELLGRTKGLWYMRHSEEFSEDIFHDTIINCVNECCMLNDKENIFCYFFHSYEANMLREKQYSCNKVTCSITIDIDKTYLPDEYESFESEIYNIIKKEKGERIANIILDYAHGYTFPELVKKYNIKNIHKKAQPLRKYVRELIEKYKKSTII